MMMCWCKLNCSNNSRGYCKIRNNTYGSPSNYNCFLPHIPLYMWHYRHYCMSPDRLRNMIVCSIVNMNCIFRWKSFYRYRYNRYSNCQYIRRSIPLYNQRNNLPNMCLYNLSYSLLYNWYNL